LTIYDKFGKVAQYFYEDSIEIVHETLTELFEQYKIMIDSISSQQHREKIVILERKLAWIIRMMSKMLTIRSNDPSIIAGKAHQYKICAIVFSFISISNNLYQVPSSFFFIIII
jgi:hypothetical protein